MENKTDTVPKKNKAGKPADKQRTAKKSFFSFGQTAKGKKNVATPAVIAVSIFAVVVIICVSLMLKQNTLDPKETFNKFIETMKNENINAAADAYCVIPEMLHLDMTEYQYELFESIKENIAFSFVSQSFVNQGQSAVVSVNLTAFDITSFTESVNESLKTDEKYLAFTTQEERLLYKRNILTDTAKASADNFLIINTVKIGFSEIENEWKIIVDDAFLKAFLGVSE